MVAFFGEDGAEDTEECDTAPLRSLYKPCASNPATASCTFCSPSLSNCCTSSCSTLTHHSKSSPWKREKGPVTRDILSHKIVKEQSERLSNTKPRGIPDLTTPVPSPLPTLAPLPLPPMTSPNPPHTPLLLLPLPLLLLTTHLQMKTTPNEQRGSGWKSW